MLKREVLIPIARPKLKILFYVIDWLIDFFFFHKTNFSSVFSIFKSIFSLKNLVNDSVEKKVVWPSPPNALEGANDCLSWKLAQTKQKTKKISEKRFGWNQDFKTVLAEAYFPVW